MANNNKTLFIGFNGQIESAIIQSSNGTLIYDGLKFGDNIKCCINIDEIKYFYKIKGDTNKVAVVLKDDDKTIIANCGLEEFEKLMTYFTGVNINSNM